MHARLIGYCSIIYESYISHVSYLTLWNKNTFLLSYPYFRERYLFVMVMNMTMIDCHAQVLLKMDQINEKCCHSQDIVAATLKLPINKVMCHVKRVGGSFGGKTFKSGILAAIAAFAANK